MSRIIPEKGRPRRIQIRFHRLSLALWRSLSTFSDITIGVTVGVGALVRLRGVGVTKVRLGSCMVAIGKGVDAFDVYFRSMQFYWIKYCKMSPRSLGWKKLRAWRIQRRDGSGSLQIAVPNTAKQTARQNFNLYRLRPLLSSSFPPSSPLQKLQYGWFLSALLSHLLSRHDTWLSRWWGPYRLAIASLVISNSPCLCHCPDHLLYDMNHRWLIHYFVAQGRYQIHYQVQYQIHEAWRKGQGSLQAQVYRRLFASRCRSNLWYRRVREILAWSHQSRWQGGQPRW